MCTNLTLVIVAVAPFYDHSYFSVVLNPKQNKSKEWLVSGLAMSCFSANRTDIIYI